MTQQDRGVWHKRWFVEQYKLVLGGQTVGALTLGDGMSGAASIGQDEWRFRVVYPSLVVKHVGVTSGHDIVVDAVRPEVAAAVWMMRTHEVRRTDTTYVARFERTSWREQQWQMADSTPLIRFIAHPLNANIDVVLLPASEALDEQENDMLLLLGMYHIVLDRLNSSDVGPGYVGSY